MIRYGIVGTNFITDWFIEAGKQTDDFELTAVCSRTVERGKAFAAKHGAAQTFTDITEMASSPDIDAVYIASPTSRHKEQAIISMQHGKHVLCEKPMASHDLEVAEMMRTAADNHVVLMEAVKHTALPGFQEIKRVVNEIGPVRRMVTSYCQYSSRYDAYKDGNVLNAFKPEYSNGALMDIGFYCLYPVVDLFGKPEHIQASGILLASGVDGQGTVVLSYPDMEAVAMYSKITDSTLPSEIQGERGSLVMNHIQKLTDVHVNFRDGTTRDLTFETGYHHMSYEIDRFQKRIKGVDDDPTVNSLQTSHVTSQIMTEARDQLGVRFPADESRQKRI